jgi:hypothetical protein
MQASPKRGSAHTTPAASALAVLVAATVIACGGGGGGGTGSITLPSTPTPETPVNGPAWLSFGRDAQHSAQSGIATQPLSRIVWRTAVDTDPQYSPQGYLLVHYGSPVITTKNTVVVPVKRAAAEQYRIEAHAGGSGTLIWSMDSDYVMPAHNWTPSYNATLTAANRMVAPGAGGKIYYRDDADSASAATQTAVFYGDANYNANRAALDQQIFINTPITADTAGNLYFGFLAAGGNSLNLVSGIARIGADGKGSWVSAADASGDTQIAAVAMNSAPAVSIDQKTLYVVTKTAGTDGYIVALDTTTLQPKAKAALIDPDAGQRARVSNDGTASPTIGPDGDVYIGVLETVQNAHNQRGWLLHFNAALSQVKTPGGFGWDDTASIVPRAMLPGYAGTSDYLVMVKYNNYGRAGSGDSQNKVAILDPNSAAPDFISGKPVMKEVLTILGPTPDPRFPGGVLEWCINTAAVDPFTKSVLVNSEDGFLYRWDLSTNTLSEKIRLTSGLGESYTPTAVGADGKVYAINNAVLFAVGR